MARTKQTARKRQPDPQPDPVPVATRPAPRPLNASFKQRKLSKDWSETLNERHPQQNVNLADLLYFKKGDYVNVYSLPDEYGSKYAHIVYFDKVRRCVLWLHPWEEEGVHSLESHPEPDACARKAVCVIAG